MSNDPASGGGVPDPVREWIAGLAEEQDVTEQDLFERLFSPNGGGLLDGAGVDAGALLARVAELETEVRTLDAEVDELIRDVRERVVQVKRETDAKADRDHDHPALSEAVERADSTLETLADDVVDLDASIGDLDERIEAVGDRTARGFSNFEEILDYLLETTEDVRGKLERVAAATLDVRERTGRLARAEARRAAAEGLRRSANRHGIAEADCDHCGDRVDLRLLDAPDCPHCDARFTELEPRRGFFRSSRLRTGERPALEGEVDGAPAELASIVAEDPSAPPSFGLARDEGPVHRDPPVEDDAESDAADSSAGTAPGTAAALDVDAVSGVGPAYSKRLAAAGVETVGDLANADPVALARETDIEPGRVETLVRRAGERVESE